MSRAFLLRATTAAQAHMLRSHISSWERDLAVIARVRENDNAAERIIRGELSLARAALASDKFAPAPASNHQRASCWAWRAIIAVIAVEAVVYAMWIYNLLPATAKGL